MVEDSSTKKESPAKRQTTLDDSNIDVPESKKRKTETDVPEAVRSEPKPEATDPVTTTKAQKTEDQSSEVLQKGLIYFLFRPRVDQEKITKLVDAQRSYIILRPVPEGAKLEDDTKLTDLPAHFIELPKKQCLYHLRFLEQLRFPAD